MGGRCLCLAAVVVLVGCSHDRSSPDASDDHPLDASQDQPAHATPETGALADAPATDGAAASGDGSSDTACRVTETLSPEQSLTYAPLAIGDRWTYGGVTRARLFDSEPAEFQQRLEVTGTKSLNGVDALVVTDSTPGGSATPTEEYWSIDDSGLVNRGTAPGMTVPGTTPSAAPYREVSFPIAVCSAFEQFQMEDSVQTVTATTVMRSLEPVSVAGVTFPNALRVERDVTAQYLRPVFDGGTTARELYSAVDWYAPGLGRVKSKVTTPESEYTYQLTGASVGGVSHGVLPGGNIAFLDEDISHLAGGDRPAVASDGQNFLVLGSTSSSFTAGGMAAMLVGPTGQLIKSTPILQGGGVPVWPAVAYGGGHFLVAYPVYNGTLKAVMLGADGTQQGAPFDIQGNVAVAVAYGRGVFLVASGGPKGITVTVVNGQGAVVGEVVPYPGQQTSYPDLAFDGKNFLLVWLYTTLAPSTGPSPHVAAGRVNADGNAIDVNAAMVATAPPFQEDLSVAFDGTRYVVSWSHRISPYLEGSGDVRIARLEVDGTLLDPEGRVVAPARKNRDRRHPRIARLGAQTIIAWERGGHVAGTRVDPDGNALDSSADSDGLYLSRQPAGGTNGQTILPALTWSGDRTLLIFVERAGESMNKRQIDETLVFPW
jgi:hypothetical protein